MKKVRSFSLDLDVAAAVNKIPKNDRSRRINDILKKALIEKRSDNVSISQIKDLIESVLDGNKKDKEGPLKNNEKAINALKSITNMRMEG